MVLEEGGELIVSPISDLLLNIYHFITNSFSPFFSDGLNIVFLAIIIALVAIFIWNFYRSLSQRDLISLNLSKYNTSTHPLIYKLLAIALYFVEYIILMPILIFLWFFALSIIILLIAETSSSAAQILLISAAMVAAIRILAYHKQELAKELAKLFPFITLSVFLLSPRAFDIEAIILKISEIPSLLVNVFYYLLIIVVIEGFLRTLFTIMEFWVSEEEAEKDKKN